MLANRAIARLCGMIGIVLLSAVCPLAGVAAERAQSSGHVISKGSKPFSETWQTIRERDRAAEGHRQDEIRRGLRPPHGIPRVQPEEAEEEEDKLLRPGTDASTFPAPLHEPRFKLSVPGALPMSPQSLVGSGFKGDDMLEGSQASGFLFIPPDTQGAIGPNHFLELTNATVSVFTRTGTKLTTASLDNFFQVTVGAITYPRNGSTDPRVLYDRKSGRWFTCIIEIGASSAGSSNNIILVVSRTSDPVSTVWDKYVIPTAQGGATGSTKFNDYESLGIDDNGVYFGMRVFPKSGQSHARCVVTPKGTLVAASPSLGTVTDFDNISDMYSTPQPGNNFDTVTPTTKAFFVSSNHQVYGNMNYRAVTWSGSAATIDAASTVLTTPAFAAPSNVPSLNATLNADVGDMRMMMAVIRNNRMWCCRHVGVNSSGGSTSTDRTGCEFLQLGVSGASLSLLQSGRVYDTAATSPRYYFYPSLAVSGQGHVAIGMSGAKSTEFIGAWTCGRYATDPIGTMGAPTQFKAGDAKYSVSFSGSPDRWGDYSFTSLDPNDDMSMWTIQEYARTPNGAQDIWGTWIVKELAPPPTLNNPNASAIQGTNNYNLPLTGTGIYDPGTGFPNRLGITLNGGVINGISNYVVTYNSSTSANLKFDIAGNASVGTRDIVLTNPDGQTATVVAGFTVTAATPNTAPVITVPGAQSVSEDTNLAVPGISIADADVGSGDLLTTVSTSNGTVTLSTVTGLSVTSGSNGSSSLSFTGTLTNTNAALNNLTYRGALNYNGAATVSIATNDQGNSGSGGALSDSKSIAITVNAVNDAPALTAPASASGNEDADISISGLSVADVDVSTSPIQVALSTTSGTLSLGSVAGLSFTSGANGSAALTFNGLLSNVNTALGTLKYHGLSNFNGTDSVSIVASDLGANGSGGALMDNKSVTITVAAVNDAPALSAPASASGSEDLPILISGISVSDVDLGSNSIRITLNVSNGTITLGSITGLTFNSGANNTGSMIFTGTLTNVINALSGLVYTGSANFNGSDTLSIIGNDLGSTGAGGVLTDNKNVSITVSAVNDAPVITAPGFAAGNEDTSISISGLAVADVDIGTSSARLSVGCSSGNLKLASNAGLTFLFGTDNSTTMIFTGTLSNVNTALAGLTYSPTLNLSGNDTVSISVSDQGGNGSGGALSDSKAMALTVNAVNDPPVLSAPASASGSEDSPISIGAVSVSDVDLNTTPVKITITASNGSVTLASTAGLSFSAGANGTGSMIFSGSLANVNNAIAAMSYLGNANFTATDTITIIANDQGGNGLGGPQTDSKSIAVLVSPLNDPPVISAPASASGNEDTSISISSISISDVDISTSPARVTLGASLGNLKLAGATGLTFVGGSDNSTTMTFTGTITNVNTALAGLKYSPPLDYSGSDSVNISVSDQGANGAGGALSDSKAVSITVIAVNDAPVLLLPIGTQNLNEDSTVTLAAITVSDVDIGSGQYEVTLSALHGSIALASTSGLAFTSGANNSPSMTFDGNQVRVTAALNGVSYGGNANYNGSDTISVSVNDLGNTGAGGVQTGLGSVNLSIAAVNDAPVVNSPASINGNEDTSITVTGISSSDVDIGAASALLSLSVTSGTLKFASTAGLSFSSGANNSAAMAVIGTMAAFNTALNGLVYSPLANYNGADNLNITLNDQGNTGAGGAQTTPATVPINLSAVNDPPVLTVPGSQSILHDMVLNISGTSLVDIDLAAGELQVVISAAHGKLTLASSAGLTFTVGDGTSDPSMTFTGSLQAINAALATISYLGNSGYSGADAISITANDQGFTGSGGNLSDTDSITINVAVPIGISELLTE